MKKILSLQGLKFFAFFNIFLFHSLIIVKFPFSFSNIGVEFFFILAGFLTFYSNNNSFNDGSSFKNGINYAKKKIKSVYPYFIISLIMKSPITLYKMYLQFNGNFSIILIDFVKKIIPSLFLVQSFIPNEEYYYFLNGVSWFLDVLIFCYLLSPLFINMIKKAKNKTGLTLILLITFRIFSFILLKKYFGSIGDYLTYIFPPYRLLDFIIGMLLCIICMKDDFGKYIHSFMEYMIVLIFILVTILNLWSNDIVQILISCITIIIFYYEKGYISKFLSSKILVFLGNLSLYLFLFHQPIIKYFEFISEKINNQNVNYVIFIISFFVTILFSTFIDKFVKKYKRM